MRADGCWRSSARASVSIRAASRIKPADRMEEMKMDKTGACTVISAIATVAQLAPGTPLLALAPAVENMPGPHSTRPGDIVRALNGKTVDIINTDAEGRLILGDAMTYAERLGATHIVDVATLTGAVGRALGHLVTGAFGTPQGWYDEVMAAATLGPASVTGSCRSSTSTGPRWTAGTPTSSTPGRPRGRLDQERDLPARVRHRSPGSTSTSRRPRTSARRCPWAPRGVDGRCPCDARGARAGRAASVRRSLGLSLTGSDPAVVGIVLGARRARLGLRGRPDRRPLAGPRRRVDPADRLADADRHGHRRRCALPAAVAVSDSRPRSPCSRPGSSSSQLLLATDLDQRLLPDSSRCR